MTGRDPVPQSQTSRLVSLSAVMFSVLAPLLFVLIFVLVTTIGYATAGRTLAPLAIGATALGLVSSVAALCIPRSRVVGVTTLLVILPCVVLAGLAVVSLVSPA
ncbi:MAG: hypothetical protein RI885_183 [Actinomycetota bacterium]|jgi:hypothetical protein